jgi:hypothetical protein
MTTRKLKGNILSGKGWGRVKDQFYTKETDVQAKFNDIKETDSQAEPDFIY